MLESGRSLQHIINDILDFSKIEADKMELRPTAASLGELLATVHKLYSGAASTKGVTLEYSIDSQISPALTFDSLRLRQVLNNLVSNALKFTSRGAVSIEARLLARRNGVEEVLFRVADTGIGIAPENQERLFQPFVQTDSDIARAGVGTGLGLTICRRLVHLMGGTIGLRSDVGHGTTAEVTLTLPIADPADIRNDAALDRDARGRIASRRQAPSSAQAQAEGTLVLIVDDHPTNRMLLCRQTAMLGYAAETAGDGAVALSKWQSGRFAAVITDLNMP